MQTPELKTYFETFKTDKFGNINLTGILDVQAFSRINVDVIQYPPTPVKMTVMCTIGKISGWTLGELVGQFPAGAAGKIHTYEVTGPELEVSLTGGPPNTDVPIQAWVFLH